MKIKELGYLFLIFFIQMNKVNYLNGCTSLAVHVNMFNKEVELISLCKISAVNI